MGLFFWVLYSYLKTTEGVYKAGLGGYRAKDFEKQKTVADA